MAQQYHIGDINEKVKILVIIYTHTNSKDGSIIFEESDIRVASIGNNETFVKDDFDKIWESINHIDTKDMIAEEWYLLGFKRNWDDDGSGSLSQCWFELIESELINIESYPLI